MALKPLAGAQDAGKIRGRLSHSHLPLCSAQVRVGCAPTLEKEQRTRKAWVGKGDCRMGLGFAKKRWFGQGSKGRQGYAEEAPTA